MADYLGSDLTTSDQLLGQGTGLFDPSHRRGQGCDLLCLCYTLKACLFVQEARSGRAVTRHACIRGSDVDEGSFQAGRQSC
jgi:hypothetical protein